MFRSWSKARLVKELRGVAYATLLTAAFAAALLFFVVKTALADGDVIFIIPVVIAAARWGIIPAVVAALLGAGASSYLFYPPIYSFAIRDTQEVVTLALFIFVAVVISHLATRLKRELERSRQREIDLRDLYAFSRRLAVAYDVSDIHAAIQEHLASILQRKVALFASARDALSGSGRREGVIVPDKVRVAAGEIAAGTREMNASVPVNTETGEVWLVHAVSPKTLEFGVIAIKLGHENRATVNELRVRVDAVLADATATLERLGVAHAISEARMRSQTDRLREALIGSVSHELRTPLASIMGAATVIGSAPALNGEEKLKALIYDVRNEAERLNQDIQNLLDASRISSDGINPRAEWADVADIVNSAVQRCERRLSGHRLTVDLPADLPLIHVDPVLVQQSLVQIFDNAVKYSAPTSTIAVSARASDGEVLISVSDEGQGLTSQEKERIWDRFFRGERHLTTTSGSGLGLWIASSFVAANGGRIVAESAGAGHGTRMSIALPVKVSAENQMESEADE
ncbi:MAG: DUF4118 domain-containing protein [Pseudolabrys sp.]|nr:DUF4118 domain-containing protein [Pseudolabrys sp.]MBV9955604.1 DUF4118 domain-containing protein [Pseudolabrys sp.]